MRRVVVALPNGFTLANLLCGIFAIVLASRGEFGRAAFFIVIGGVADALDGRVARATRTGSRFGEELDSLVDAISFGLAPAMLVYFAVLSHTGWDWIYVFVFTSCAVMRLARFNVEQAGTKKTHFHGLPSPAAGMTLATYYWFSQTSLYSEAVILLTQDKVLADFPWHVIMRYLMVGLAFLMVSDVPYAAVPTVGWRSLRQLSGTALVIGTVLGLIFVPRQFFFPALLAYVLFGVIKWAALGFLDRVPTGDSIFKEEEEDEDVDRPPLVTVTETPDELAAGRRRRRRRRRRGDRPTPLNNPAVEEDGE
jgi:CDP-diacylglycerol--serine O-phosphatidyltransferase